MENVKDCRRVSKRLAGVVEADMWCGGRGLNIAYPRHKSKNTPDHWMVVQLGKHPIKWRCSIVDMLAYAEREVVQVPAGLLSEAQALVAHGG